MERVRGLDAIRAVCAFWVVLSHFGGPPLTAGIDKSHWLGWGIGGVYNNFWNGPAAVIIFFVISGFCIHYPFSRTLRVPGLAEYATRRYLRVGIPLCVAVALSPHLGMELYLFHDSILWSLVAELVYYTLYPALLGLRRQGVTWRWMFLVSFLIALILVSTNPGAKGYPSWGVSLNWLLGLPCWLLGCELAERATDRSLQATTSIWSWRFTIWGLAVCCSMLRFHSPVGYPWTLNVFALPVTLWLSREIDFYRRGEPLAWLEWAGKWSYSLYLMHFPVQALYVSFAVPNLGYILNWMLQTAFILGCSYVFYLVIEYPGHVMARSASKALSRKRSVLPSMAPRL